MKKAKLAVVTFVVECPYCQQETIDPFYGSYHWLASEIKAGKTGQSFGCEECGEKFILPKLVADNKLS